MTTVDQQTRRLGLVVNPVAGLGGRIGRKGSDDPAVQREAERRGVPRRAGERATRALVRLAAVGGPVELLAAPGPMGADAARAAGLEPRSVGPRPPAATTADDTRRAVAALVDAGVDLLLVAGGDGTLRAVQDVLGERLPVLGIPAGVKMQSGAFAAGPEAAGEVAAAFLAGPRDVVRAEVADIDEQALREDRIAARLHGAVLVPRAPGRVLAAKGGSSRRPDATLAAAADRLLADRAPGQLVLIGPGTTAGLLPARLGLPSTLLGVDALRDDALVGRDLDEEGILALLDGAPDALLVLGVVGVQGTLLGRGNQQLSPAVLRRIGRDRLRVLAAKEKLAALRPAILRIDSGDPALDAALAGQLPVRVSGRETMILPLEP
ncbi:ATP-NAD kinase family protein [Patulibacter defluvii]|uniref:ATP-NAD kinase family protein n=1 Tax=Patulibacter defluvii TaxID=3095358 RepID=UPI002A74F6E1|nr:NAD(+)/NADH kinase [Patulibacter sp. DM4]